MATYSIHSTFIHSTVSGVSFKALEFVYGPLRTLNSWSQSKVRRRNRGHQTGGGGGDQKNVARNRPTISRTRKRELKVATIPLFRLKQFTSTNTFRQETVLRHALNVEKHLEAYF